MAANSQDLKASFVVTAENDTKSTFQEIKSDAAEMAGSVEQSGERAARDVKGIGDGAEIAAQKLTREEGRITSALIRATEQARIAAQAGTSMAKAFELKADKADFKSLANSIIADIVRTQVRAQASGLFGSLVNGITGLFGGSPSSAGASATSILNSGIGFGSLAGGRATGGGVLPRSIYEVNERDVPEVASFGGKQYLMTADQSGSVTPLAQATTAMPARALAAQASGGASAVQVQVYVDANSGSGQVQASASGSGNESMAQLGKLLGNAVKEQLTREMRPGGLLWSQRNGRA